MYRDAIRAAVDAHFCLVDGVRYEFKLNWIAVERYCDPTLARHLLNIEFVATPESPAEPARLQMLVWLADLSELTSLLDDALQSHLTEQAIGGGEEHARNRGAHSWRPALVPTTIWPN